MRVSDDGKILLYWEDRNAVKVVIPDGIVEIGEEAFACFEHLEEVIIPNTVKRIKAKAFYKCIKLKRVHMPMYLDEIGERAFQFDGELEEIMIPNGVCVIEDDTFSGCYRLKRLYDMGCSYLRKIYVSAIEDTELKLNDLPKSSNHKWKLVGKYYIAEAV